MVLRFSSHVNSTWPLAVSFELAAVAGPPRIVCVGPLASLNYAAFGCQIGLASSVGNF